MPSSSEGASSEEASSASAARPSEASESASPAGASSSLGASSLGVSSAGAFSAGASSACSSAGFCSVGFSSAWGASSSFPWVSFFSSSAIRPSARVRGRFLAPWPPSAGAQRPCGPRSGGRCSPARPWRAGGGGRSAPRASGGCAPPARRPSDCGPRKPSSLRLRALTADELGPDRKLVARQAQGVLGEVLRDAGELEHHPAGLHYCNPALGVALAGAHPSLGRLAGHRLVGKDVDPDLPAALDLSRHRDSGGLDLAVGDPAAIDRLQPVLAEGDAVAALRISAAAATLLLAVANPLRHQHQRPPPSSSACSER